MTQRRSFVFRLFCRGFFLLVIVVGLSACGPEIVQSGNLPPQDKVNQLVRGETTKDRARSLLGSPSSVSAFADKTWLYISRKTQRRAFLEPRVLQQLVLALSFNDQDTLQEARIYTVKDGKVINPVGRKTPTTGRQIGVVEQLIGNLGKFN